MQQNLQCYIVIRKDIPDCIPGSSEIPKELTSKSLIKQAMKKYTNFVTK